MTDLAAEYRENGERLGYPSCCVERFIAVTDDAAVSRGCIWVGIRPNGHLKLYVPCEACMGGPGWHPFGTPSEDIVPTLPYLDEEVAA